MCQTKTRLDDFSKCLFNMVLTHIIHFIVILKHGEETATHIRFELNLDANYR